MIISDDVFAEGFLALATQEQSRACRSLAARLPEGFEYLSASRDGIHIFEFTTLKKRFVLLPAGSTTIGLSPAERKRVSERLACDGAGDLDSLGVTIDSLPGSKTVRTVPFLCAVSPITISEAKVLGQYRDDWERPVSLDESDHDVYFFAIDEVDEITNALQRFSADLPTELEWERAARGTAAELFWFGDELEDSELLAAAMSLSTLADLRNTAGLSNLSVGEFCYGSLGKSDMCTTTKTRDFVIRGSGAQSWPWQHPAEWLTATTAFRVPAPTNSYAAVRPIVRLSAT